MREDSQAVLVLTVVPLVVVPRPIRGLWVASRKLRRPLSGKSCRESSLGSGEKVILFGETSIRFLFDLLF
jgi:hypothetical protein